MTASEAVSSPRQGMNIETKHREISRQLLAEIAVGKYGPAGRLPSETQLVKRFGVSRPTVARAFRELQNEGLIERRAGSGTYVRRQTGSAANTRQLGLLIPGLGAVEIFSIICGEIASLARAQDYTVLWGDSAQPGQDENMSREHAVELCGQFIARRVAGVFFAPFDLADGKADVNHRIAERFSQAGIPVVLLDRDLVPFPQRSRFDLVASDNIAGGSLLAEHLLKLGCRRIAFAAWPGFPSTVQARIAGVREALVRQGIEAPPDWIHIGNVEDVKFVRSLTGGRRWDAVICANDVTAAQLLRALYKNNVSVPRDLRIVGFDDVNHAAPVSVPLTTIHQPCREIAVIAYRALIERIAEPTLPARALSLTPQLVVRESCGAYLPRKEKAY
ncbi:MAG TPA: GntR family transcriptional regulator [Verrucomicrobiae bacterium]|nr:GntR family transcriptional regulator [Verrucomicrobiae bacterium]